MNQVYLVGKVGKDPIIKEIGSKGTLVCEFSVATSSKKYGTEDWLTEWHNVKGFGKVAEKVRDQVRKGDTVAIAGSLQTATWEKDGSKHYKTVVMLGFSESVVCQMKAGTTEPASSGTDFPEEADGY